MKRTIITVLLSVFMLVQVLAGPLMVFALDLEDNLNNTTLELPLEDPENTYSEDIPLDIPSLGENITTDETSTGTEVDDSNTAPPIEPLPLDDQPDFLPLEDDPSLPLEDLPDLPLENEFVLPLEDETSLPLEPTETQDDLELEGLELGEEQVHTPVFSTMSSIPEPNEPYTWEDFSLTYRSSGYVLDGLSFSGREKIIKNNMVLSFPDSHYKGTPVTLIKDYVFESVGLLSVDLSKLTSLKHIGRYAFASNQLTSVDLSGLNTLEIIKEGAFANNKLTSADFSGLTSLVTIEQDTFRKNRLASVDFSSLTSLIALHDTVFADNKPNGSTIELVKITPPNGNPNNLQDATNTSKGGHTIEEQVYNLNVIKVDGVGISPVVKDTTSEPILNCITIRAYDNVNITNSLSSAVFEFTDISNNISYDVVDNRDGTYSIQNVPLGSYNLKVKYPPDGFLFDSKKDYTIVLDKEYHGCYIKEIPFSKGGYLPETSGWEIREPYDCADFSITNDGMITSFKSSAVQKLSANNGVLDFPLLPCNGVPIKGIAEDTFSYLRGVEVVFFPPNIETIGDRAFAYSSLKYVYFSSRGNIRTIGDDAFRNNNIQDVGLDHLPSLETIGSNAFSNNQIKSLDLSETSSLREIKSSAFFNNKIRTVNMTGLTSLSSIYQEAFAGNNIKGVNFSDLKQLTYLDDDAFIRNKQDMGNEKPVQIMPPEGNPNNLKNSSTGGHIIRIHNTITKADNTFTVLKGSVFEIPETYNTLGGAVFELFKFNEETASYDSVGTAKTDNDTGVASFTGLKTGKYLIKEITAPDGYEINSTEYELIIDDDTRVPDNSFTLKHINWPKPVAKKQLNSISDESVQNVDRNDLLKHNLLISLPDDISEYKNFSVSNIADEGIIFLDDIENVVSAKADGKTSIMLDGVDVSSLFVVNRLSDTEFTVRANVDNQNELWKTAMKAGQLDIEVYAKWAPSTIAPSIADTTNSSGAYTDMFTLAYSNVFDTTGEIKTIASNKVNANPVDTLPNELYDLDITKVDGVGVTAIVKDLTPEPVLNCITIRAYDLFDINRLLSDASFKFTSTSDSSITYDVIDNYDGTYSIKNVPQGTYNLSLNYPPAGFSASEQDNYLITLDKMYDGCYIKDFPFVTGNNIPESSGWGAQYMYTWNDFVFNNNKIAGFADSGHAKLAQNNGNLVFPGSHYNGSPITAIESYAFYGLNIKAVDLSPLTELVTIGESAFDNNQIYFVNMSNLRKLERIDYKAFVNNNIGKNNGWLYMRNLTSLKTIGRSAFENNFIEVLDLSGLTSLELIEEQAFLSNNIGYLNMLGLSSLNKVFLAAFADNKIKSVSLLNSLQLNYIDDGAFYANDPNGTGDQPVVIIPPEGNPNNLQDSIDGGHTIRKLNTSVMSPPTNNFSVVKGYSFEIPESYNTLGGATFELFKFDEGTASYVSMGTSETSQGTGVASFADLGIGRYLIKETVAPNGYDINPTEYELVIDENTNVSDNKITLKHINWTAPVVEKQLNGKPSGDVQNVSRDKLLKYNLLVDLPDNITEYKNFTITDTVDDGIIFLEDVGNVVSTKTDGKTSIMLDGVDVSSLFTVNRSSDTQITITANITNQNALWKETIKSGKLDIEIYAKWAPKTIAPHIPNTTSPSDAYSNTYTLTYNSLLSSNEGTKSTTSNEVNANPTENLYSLDVIKVDGVDIVPIVKEETPEEPLGCVTVKAVDPSNKNKLIKGAAFKLVNILDETAVYNTTDNYDGTYSIEGIPFGTYELFMTKAPIYYGLAPSDKVFGTVTIDDNLNGCYRLDANVGSPTLPQTGASCIGTRAILPSGVPIDHVRFELKEINQPNAEPTIFYTNVEGYGIEWIGIPQGPHAPIEYVLSMYIDPNYTGISCPGGVPSIGAGEPCGGSIKISDEMFDIADGATGYCLGSIDWIIGETGTPSDPNYYEETPTPPTPPEDPEPTHKSCVSVTLLDSITSGKIQGARLALKEMKPNGTDHYLVENKSGSYLIKDIEPGKYFLYIANNLPDYVTTSFGHEIIVEESINLSCQDLEFTLDPLPDLPPETPTPEEPPFPFSLMIEEQSIPSPMYASRSTSGFSVSKGELFEIPESYNTLGGAVFELFKFDETTAKYVSIGTAETDGITGIASFTNLDTGRYLIKETTAPEGYDINPTEYEFVIDENTSVPNDKFILEHINWPAPAIEKQLNDKADENIQNVNRGDLLKYNLLIDLPSDITEYKHFAITDTADDGVVFLESIGNLVPTKTDGKTSIMLDGVDVSSLFTVKRTSDTEFTVKANIEEQAELWKETIKSGKLDIEVYAKWAPNTTAPRITEIVKPSDAYTNAYTLTYSNMFSTASEVKIITSNEVNANPFELVINILKTESDGQTPITGAEFILTPVSGTAFMDDYIESNTRTITVGVDGKATVSDLDGGVYELKETKAPDGYKLLDKPIKISVSETTGGLKHDNTIGLQLLINTVVKNHKNNEILPNTGTLLTIGFASFGSMLLIISKKIKKEK